MSLFNKPYRTDKQMEADAELKRKQAKMKRRETKNRLAQQIFEAVISEIEENDKDNFSKREMIELVAGSAKLNQGEWYVWNNAATVAIQRVRRYFWSKRKDATKPCAFNYVDGRYWLISLDDDLKANIVYDAYQRKMQGIGQKQRQLATSAYQKVLELDDVARAELIQQLREDKLLNNGN
jgi:hypothetical protein